MRSREKLCHVYTNTPVLYSQADGSSDLVPWALSIPTDYCSSVSTIEDENHGRSRAPGSCTHRRVELNAPPCKVWSRAIGGWREELRMSSATMYSGGPTITTTLAQSTAIQRAISGILDDEVNTPVFLKELPELRETYHTLRNRQFGVKQFASKFLAYKFGILPFLGDLNKLAQGPGKIRAHIDKINSMQGQVMRRTLKSGEIAGEQSYTDWVGGQPVTRYQSWTGDVRTKVRTRVVRRYTSQDEIDAYLDYYGSTIGKVAWELIPYSFVVDWFIDTGSVIDALSPKNQKPMATLETAFSLVKASVSLPVVTYDARSAAPRSMGSKVYHYFRRSIGTLNPNSIAGEGLTLSRSTVGGALLLQKLA